MEEGRIGVESGGVWTGLEGRIREEGVAKM